MKDKVEAMAKESMHAAELLRSAKRIRVLTHYDADGISAGAIAVKALDRAGKAFHLTSVKQLSEEIIRDVASDKADLILITDMGAGLLNEIQEHLLPAGKKVVILDHHQIQGTIQKENQEMVVHLNPVNFGIEENISGSGVTYICMRALDQDNRDLSELAIIGARGDSQMGCIGPDWGMLGLNKEILKDAEATRKIRVAKGLRLWGRYTRSIHKALQFSVDPYIPEVSGSEMGAIHFLQELGIRLKRNDGSWRSLSDLSDDEMKKLSTGIIRERIKNGSNNPDWIFGDVYELTDKEGEFRDANEFATMLNSCGKMNRTHAGIAICLNNRNYYDEVRDVLEDYRRELGRCVEWVRKQRTAIKRTDNADYIIAGNRISEHIISNVVSIVHRSHLVPDGKHRPVFAFAETDDGQIKVSARMDDSLVEKGLNLKLILESATKKTGGQGGGHAAAGGATFPKDELKRFIDITDLLIREALDQQPETDTGILISAIMDGFGAKDTQSNLNSTEQKIEEPRDFIFGPRKPGASYGRKTQRFGKEGKTAAGRLGQEKDGAKKGDNQGAVGQEVERKGLVRYFGA